MMYVKSANGGWQGWHVGEPLPRALTSQKVVTLQADCDELDAIIFALTPKSISTHTLEVHHSLTNEGDKNANAQRNTPESS